MHFYSDIVATRARRDSSCDRELVDPVDEAGMSESDESEISITSIEDGMSLSEKSEISIEDGIAVLDESRISVVLSRSRIFLVNKKRLMVDVDVAD